MHLTRAFPFRMTFESCHSIKYSITMLVQSFRHKNHNKQRWVDFWVKVRIVRPAPNCPIWVCQETQKSTPNLCSKMKHNLRLITQKNQHVITWTHSIKLRLRIITSKQQQKHTKKMRLLYHEESLKSQPTRRKKHNLYERFKGDTTLKSCRSLIGS